jgi:hypothetical protein
MWLKWVRLPRQARTKKNLLKTDIFLKNYGRAQGLFSRVVLSNYTLNTAKTIFQEEIKQIFINFSKENANILDQTYLKNNQFGYYLAGFFFFHRPKVEEKKKEMDILLCQL